MIAEYRASHHVEYAEPNYIVRPNMVPNDPYYLSDYSWGLKDIYMEDAWDMSQGEGIIVAVVDSGVDYNNEDLRSNMFSVNGSYGFDFINSLDRNGDGDYEDQGDIKDTDPMDDAYHGTLIASVIAAVGNNNKGSIGVAPKAKILAIKALDKDGVGTDLEVNNAIKYAVDNGARIINCSMSSYGFSELTKETALYAYSHGCVLVTGSGNENSDVRYYYPANLPYFITASAFEVFASHLASYANTGIKVDVCAPETGLLYLNDQEGLIGKGTSVASAYVSGLAALVAAKYPTYSNDEISKAIYTGTTDLGNSGWICIMALVKSMPGIR
jgi:subtilisin family serine protease